VGTNDWGGGGVGLECWTGTGVGWLAGAPDAEGTWVGKTSCVKEVCGGGKVGATVTSGHGVTGLGVGAGRSFSQPASTNANKTSTETKICTPKRFFMGLPPGDNEWRDINVS